MVRVDEYLSLGKGSIIFDHLQRNFQCKEECNKLSFKIIDQVKWKKPTLNKQIKHIRLNISV